jgi:hypothetical protein
VVTTATLYRTNIRHTRTETVDHRFAYSHEMWLVDVDDLPAVPRWLRPLLTFDARDHLGDPDATIRANVDAYLAERGIDLAGGPVLMLANPRSLGHAFNPLTVFWCSRPDGVLAAIVAEVHNTHGEHHCYLLRTDRRGRARVAKEFSVSPFFGVDGTYDVRCSQPGDDLAVSITLRRGPALEPVFTATLTGRADRTVRSVTAAALRHPWSSWRVSTLIRWEGLRLWLRRVPVVPWRPHTAPEPVPHESLRHDPLLHDPASEESVR